MLLSSYKMYILGEKQILLFYDTPYILRILIYSINGRGMNCMVYC